MKLLLDENLSIHLVALLAGDFAGCVHVEQALERGCSDAELWDYARSNGFTIVSKDNDFRQRAFVAGPPPKVVWLSVGNAGTSVIADLLRSKTEALSRFEEAAEEALLVLTAPTRQL